MLTCARVLLHALYLRIIIRYTANAALIAVAYAAALDDGGGGLAEEGLAEVAKYRSWARGQIDYMLGRSNTLGPNGAGFSFLVGYSDHYPRKVHHQMATCQKAPAPCDWSTFNDESKPNAYACQHHHCQQLSFNLFVFGSNSRGH